MNLEISVKNYRCFNDLAPARLKLQRGISALIGANNVGKSTLLRLFYELRPFVPKGGGAAPEACLSLFD
ncbi:MAG: ATP-binding protein, partial [Blastochloris sp.]|nr:ATP-binding protein [Blastochloris sp.]